MPRVPVREALAEKEDRDGDLCQSCSAPALDDSHYCRNCRDYWAEVDAGMFNAWDDW